MKEKYTNFLSQNLGVFPFFVAIVFCAAVSWMFAIPGRLTAGELNALIGSTIACAVSYAYWRRIGPRQSVDSSYTAIWALIIVFAGFAALAFFVKFELSRLVFLVGLGSSCIIFLVLQQVRMRLIRSRFCVLSGGRIEDHPRSKYCDYFDVSEEFVDQVLSYPPEKDQLVKLLYNMTGGGRVDGFVADLHFKHPSRIQRLIVRSVLAGIPVYHFRQLDEMLSGRISIDYLTENQFGATLPYMPYVHVKRVLDILLVLALLPVILPIMVVVALAILLTDGGPLFFRQERVGYRGRIFKIWKFRTMRELDNDDDDEEDTDPKNEQALAHVFEKAEKNGSIVTPVGKLLRRYRLDELPQVINILLGQMSWVGPRPETKELVAAFRERVRFYNYRQAVLPGITGWAQVKQGHVMSAEEAEEKLRYDFYYLKHFSPWLDFTIFIKTIRVILMGKGAV